MSRIDVKRDTTRDLFNATLRLVKDNGEYEKAEAIMDYYLPKEYEDSAALREDIELTNYRFDLYAVPSFGGSEGIYIDVWIHGEYTEYELKMYNHSTGQVEPEYRRNIGTFKTLKDDLESMKIMGELCGSLVYFATEYINKNIERYTPTKELEAEKARKEKDGQMGRAQDMMSEWLAEAQHNLLCYSDDYLMTMPKEGCETEYKEALEEVKTLKAMIEPDDTAQEILARKINDFEREGTEMEQKTNSKIDVRAYPLETGGMLKGFANVTVDGIAINSVAVKEGQYGLFSSLPAKKYEKDGKTEYMPYAKVSDALKSDINKAVLAEYGRQLALPADTRGYDDMPKTEQDIDVENTQVKAYVNLIKEPKDTLMGYARAEAGDVAINNIKIVKAENGLFAAMPQTSRPGKDGKPEYFPAVFPADAALASKVNQAVIDKYNKTAEHEKNKQNTQQGYSGKIECNRGSKPVAAAKDHQKEAGRERTD